MTVFSLRCEICGREWSQVHGSRQELERNLSRRRSCEGGVFPHLSSVPILDITTVFGVVMSYPQDEPDLDDLAGGKVESKTPPLDSEV